MEDVHNIEHELDLNNQKFKESEHVSDEDKKAVQEFCDKCFATGIVFPLYHILDLGISPVYTSLMGFWNVRNSRKSVFFWFHFHTERLR